MNLTGYAILATAGLCVFAGWLVVHRLRRPHVRLSNVTAAPRGGTVRIERIRLARGLVEHLLVTRTWLSATCVVGMAAAICWALGGPVAATVAALYALVAVYGVRAWVVRRRTDRAYTEILDALDAAIADLRAGLVSEPGARTGTGMGTRGPASGDTAVRAAVERIDAAYRISEALGTPLADLLDRVDGDLRASSRLRATVDAQTSGARATSVVLVALPVAGLLLGAGLGVDPVEQLLHTPLGGSCAVVAATLQCAGLVWIGRIVRGVATEVR